MREQWRYFQFGQHHILALPPDAYEALTVWVHYEDGSIQREHMKPERLDTLTEITEEEARRLDPVMFRACLDRPYYDAPTMMAFYQQHYEDELAVIQDHPSTEQFTTGGNIELQMREGNALS